MQTYLVDSFKYCTYFFFKHFKLFTLITIEKKKFFRVYKTVQDINIDVSCNIIYNMQFLKKKNNFVELNSEKENLMIISAIDNKFTITFSYSKYLRIKHNFVCCVWYWEPHLNVLHMYIVIQGHEWVFVLPSHIIYRLMFAVSILTLGNHSLTTINVCGCVMLWSKLMVWKRKRLLTRNKNGH